MEKNLEGQLFHSLNEGSCCSLSGQPWPHELDFLLSKAFSGASLSELKFRALNITLNPTWKKERSFWWQLLITVKKGIKLCMERSTSMLQVQQSVWKGIFRGEGKEKGKKSSWMWLFDLESAWRKRGRCNWVCEKESLKDQWLHLNPATQYLPMVWTLIRCVGAVTARAHVASPHFGEATEQISEVRHKMPSRPLWHPPAQPEEDPGPSAQATCGARNILNSLVPLFSLCVCTHLPVSYENLPFLIDPAKP